MALGEEEIVPYLANVLLVALADKSLTPVEVNALEDVRKGVNAKKNQVASAKKMVEVESYTFRKTGSFSDQIRNLEDILTVALVDSDLSAQELALVKKYCQLVGIYDDQLDMMVMEASRRYEVGTDAIVCPACSTVTPPGARFCPSCGKVIANIETVPAHDLYQIPTEGYALEFCESTSGGFVTALEHAKATATLQTRTINKKTWYLVNFPASRFLDCVPLATALSGMRHRRIYVDGKEGNWSEVFAFTWCASRRSTAYRPVKYCFGKDENRLNPWGCKQAQMEWVEWGRWLSYGRWQKKGMFSTGYMFIFDKQRIRHELQTALFRYRYCPHMRMDLPEAVLRHLPEQVEVTESGDWKYNRCYDALSGTIKVIERQESGGISYTSEYESDGVRPRNLKLLGEILQKAFRECGVRDVEASVLVSK